VQGSEALRSALLSSFFVCLKLSPFKPSVTERLLVVVLWTLDTVVPGDGSGSPADNCTDAIGGPAAGDCPDPNP
jgi:hypothetical protein